MSRGTGKAPSAVGGLRPASREGRAYTYRVFASRPGQVEPGWRRLTIESAPCPWMARERAVSMLRRAGYEVRAIDEVAR